MSTSSGSSPAQTGDPDASPFSALWSRARGALPQAIASSTQPRVTLQNYDPSVYRQWVSLSQAAESTGLPFHGELKSRRAVSIESFFKTFQTDHVRHAYLTWARNVWRIRALQRMKANMTLWRNASIMSAFATWATRTYQLKSLRSVAHRLHVHGQSHGREHCFRVRVHMQCSL